MNAKSLIPLVAGLAIGGLALRMGFSTLKNAQAAKKPVDTVTVWTAVQNIPRGTEITEDLIASKSFPAGMLPEGAFTEKDALIGRIPVLVAPAGLPVLESMLAPPGTPAGIHPPAGLRAIAIKIDESSGVDYHLEPGSRVDVYGSRKIHRDGRQETVAKVIVENAEVAAVGPRLSPTSDTGGSDARDRDRTRSIRAVTLFVKPEQVKQILLIEQQGGRFKLSLRGENDTQIDGNDEWQPQGDLFGDAPNPPRDDPAAAQTAQSKPSAFDWFRQMVADMQAGAAAAPPPPAPKPWVVTVYRGGKAVEVVRYRSRTSRERVDEGDAANEPPDLFGNRTQGSPVNSDPRPVPRESDPNGSDPVPSGVEPEELE